MWIGSLSPHPASSSINIRFKKNLEAYSHFSLTPYSLLNKADEYNGNVEWLFPFLWAVELVIPTHPWYSSSLWDVGSTPRALPVSTSFWMIRQAYPCFIQPLLHYQPPEWLFCLPRFPLPRQELVRQVRTPTLSSMTALFDASNRVWPFSALLSISNHSSWRRYFTFT